MAAYPPAGAPVYGAPPPGSMPPPAGGYPPAAPAITNAAPTPVVIYAQGPATQIRFYDIPVACVCPHCHAQISTQCHFETGNMTWLIAGGLLLVGCWLGCCLIPFCVDGAKDVVHVCPQCHQIVGKYERLH